MIIINQDLVNRTNHPAQKKKRKKKKWGKWAAQKEYKIVKIAVKYLKKIVLFNFKENKKTSQTKKQRIGKTKQMGKRKLFF